MQVKKIFTYTIDELPMAVQNRVIANRIQELATNTSDIVEPGLYEFLTHQYILLKKIVWNKSNGISDFHCEVKAEWFPTNTWNKKEFDEILGKSCAEWWEGHIPFWTYIGPDMFWELRKIKVLIQHNKLQEFNLVGKFNPECGKIYGAVFYKYTEGSDITHTEKAFVNHILDSLQFKFQSWINMVVNSAVEHYQTMFFEIFDPSRIFEYYRNLGSAFTENGTIVHQFTFDSGRV